eukprot:408197-Prorocentrum_minimum.AAC.1
MPATACQGTIVCSPQSPPRQPAPTRANPHLRVDGKGSEVDGKGSEVDGRGSEVGGRGSEVDGKGSEADGMGLEADGRGSEVGGRGSTLESCEFVLRGWESTLGEFRRTQPHRFSWVLRLTGVPSLSFA